MVGSVLRFDRTERNVHWLTAAAVLVAIGSGLVLYVQPLAVAVGHRAVVRDVHVVAGIASVVPLMVALVSPWGSMLRRDVHRMAMWHEDDVRWFRRRHRTAATTGKFSGGQKLSSVLMAAGLVVMLMTGSIMRWFGPFPLSWRSGATFVHDWVSFGLWFLVGAHMVKAFTTPGAMRAILTGRISRSDAERRPRWWASIVDDQPR